jgi:methionyl-tRNA formyltransferase
LPWPGAYTTFRGQQLLMLRARVAAVADGSPGRIHREKRALFAGCGENTALEMLEVQLAGKKRMSGEAFLNGYQPVENERLGD